MADSLFDVVLFDADGKAEKWLTRGQSLSAAIALSRGCNDHRKPDGLTAIVLPAGEFIEMCERELQTFPGTNESRTLEAIRDLAQDALEPDDSEPNAFDQQDDSDAEDDSENAAEEAPEPSIFDKVAARRGKFVRREFKRQLRRIWKAVDLISDPGDLGIVAASLEQVAKGCDNYQDLCHEGFDFGLSGDLRYRELEAALGVVR